VNFATPAQLADVGYTLNRWGGNRTTRYNWQLDVDNSANDWFFTNYTGQDDPPNLPAGSSADLFMLESRVAEAEVVLTLPTIGRVAGPDRERRWSFSQSLYGPQLQDECDLAPPDWCNPDAGNGRCTQAENPLHCDSAGNIVGNDPDDTTLAVGTSFVTDWVAFAASRVGPSSRGGVRYFALDNEPMLWNSTHRDVHPQPPTYDEVWSRGLAVAAAVKQQDPSAQILGPDTWGWCDLWTSAADAAGGVSCIDGPDRQAHGGLPFVAWYLTQSCAHLASTGVRPIDFLDVHYYPQSGEAFGGEAYAALRLQSTRELWDPGYTSASWIGDEVQLLPRLRGWVDSYCPGTRLALTEYSWGDDAAPSAALAQAEVLAVLGREGVDLATRWVVPASGSKTEEAFRLFLDYDGAGGRALGDRVRASSSGRTGRSVRDPRACRRAVRAAVQQGHRRARGPGLDQRRPGGRPRALSLHCRERARPGGHRDSSRGCSDAHAAGAVRDARPGAPGDEPDLPGPVRDGDLSRLVGRSALNGRVSGGLLLDPLARGIELLETLLRQPFGELVDPLDELRVGRREARARDDAMVKRRQQLARLGVDELHVEGGAARAGAHADPELRRRAAFRAVDDPADDLDVASRLDDRDRAREPVAEGGRRRSRACRR
jgi:hypothetical protein